MAKVYSKTKKGTNMKAILKKIKCQAMVKKHGQRMVVLSKENSLRIKSKDLANKLGKMEAIIKASYKTVFSMDKENTILQNNKKHTLDHSLMARWKVKVEKYGWMAVSTSVALSKE
jgi:hypothetical protein